MSEPTRKILIVDDSPEDRETWRRYLRSDPTQAYDIIERTSQEDALSACRAERPDGILLDYNLPDGTGVEFLEALRELGGTLEFPVVMLTGTGSELVAVEAMKAGAQDYLVKTRLNPEALHRTLHAAIYKAQTDRLIIRQRAEVEEAYRQAREANARKDQFLAALSHELRTPLTAILAAVSAPDVNEHTAQERGEIFTLIRRNVEMEARLIDDLLDVTRISHGKLELRRQPADVHDLVRHAAEIARPAAEAKQVAFSAEYGAGRHFVHGDPARLQQVFWNLLNNAVKFTPSGGSVRIVTRDTAPDRMEVEVTDTGVGILPESMGRIFNAFEQGGAQVTQRFGGLGLGLAICKALVEAHGGQIRVTSAGEGQGASFVVALEVGENIGPGAVAPAAPAAGGLAALDGRGRTVLLVEDHADSARMLSTLLRRRGYEVVHADTSARAEALFQTAPVDFVISDVGLPDGNGLELIKKLRAARPVPCIVLSGYGMETDLAGSLEAGAQAHVTKPVAWPELEAALRRLMLE